jgi:Zn-dependent M28 family amino/carboxypeptidase
MLLLAKRLGEERLPYKVLFVAFGGEEAGLLGSYYFVGRHGAELTRLRGMLNFDLLGFGERGVAVVGAADQEGFWGMVVRHRPPELADIPHLLRPNAPNSDHYPFREKGYPALFFYLQGGPGYYHDPLDRPETLSWHGAYSLLRWMEALLKAD